VERDRGSVRRGRRSGSAATTRAVFRARAATPEDALPHRPFHNPMMPGKRSKRNLDPSRAVALDAGGNGTPAAARDDRAVLRDSVGGAGWRIAAAGGGLVRGIGYCSIDGRGHSARRGRKPLGSLAQGKTVAAEPLHREPPPCVIAGKTGQRQWSRGRLEPALFGSPVEWLLNTEPCRSNGRVPSISRLQTR